MAVSSIKSWYFVFLSTEPRTVGNFSNYPAALSLSSHCLLNEVHYVSGSVSFLISSLNLISRTNGAVLKSETVLKLGVALHRAVLMVGLFQSSRGNKRSQSALNQQGTCLPLLEVTVITHPLSTCSLLITHIDFILVCNTNKKPENTYMVSTIQPTKLSI